MLSKKRIGIITAAVMAGGILAVFCLLSERTKNTDASISGPEVVFETDSPAENQNHGETGDNLTDHEIVNNTPIDKTGQKTVEKQKEKDPVDSASSSDIDGGEMLDNKGSAESQDTISSETHKTDSSETQDNGSSETNDGDDSQSEPIDKVNNDDLETPVIPIH